MTNELPEPLKRTFLRPYTDPIGRNTRAGLQIVQLVEQLQKVGWVRGPINKDAVKIDMQELAKQGRVRHRGNTAKWELNPEGGSEPTLFQAQ